MLDGRSHLSDKERHILGILQKTKHVPGVDRSNCGVHIGFARHKHTDSCWRKTLELLQQLDAVHIRQLQIAHQYSELVAIVKGGERVASALRDRHLEVRTEDAVHCLQDIWFVVNTKDARQFDRIRGGRVVCRARKANQKGIE